MVAARRGGSVWSTGLQAAQLAGAKASAQRLTSHESMAALAQSDDAALLEWATEALAKATGVRGRADIARHLLAQTTMEAVDEAARGLLGATPAVAAFARELSKKKGLVAATQRERRRRREAKGSLKVERTPLGRLRCGFVNAVTVEARETPVAIARRGVRRHSGRA